MTNPTSPDPIFSPALLAQLAQLCEEFREELKRGKKPNVAALIRRVVPEARSALLTELYFLRCESLSEEEAGRIALQWKTAFPEFKGMQAPRVSLQGQAPHRTEEAASGSRAIEPESPAPENPSESAASLPLELHRQIDQACLQFEADLRQGKSPDVTQLIAGFNPSGRKQLLEELLRLALEYRGSGRAAASSTPIKAEVLSDELEQTLIAVLERPLPTPASTPVSVDSETKSYLGPASPDLSTVIGVSSPEHRGATVPRNRLADYEILDELGRGGMGVVYKARQLRLQRFVALKMVLRAEFASQDELTRFRQEAEAAAQLDHPGIVPVFEVGEADGRHYFSMAYVEGKTLSRRLQEGPLALQEAAEMVRQLAIAVAYAHSRGIVHRDLKPGNVLLDNSGRPRITDFGLAKRLDIGNELTITGQIVGTPSYMPPEQARGEIEKIGTHSDVYSLGAVLYACLTGRPPFQASNPIETLQQVQHHEPARLRLLNKAIPRDLEIICLKCLAKRPSDRYVSAAHLALDLGRWQRGEPIEARPIDRFRRALMWCQRHRSLTGAVATAAVALLVLGMVQLRSSYVEAERQRTISDKQRELDAERERVTSQRRLSQLAYADQQRAEGMALSFPDRDICQGMFRLAAALRIAHDYQDAKRETLLRQDLVQASRNLKSRALGSRDALTFPESPASEGERPPGIGGEPTCRELSPDGTLLANAWKDRFWVWNREARQLSGAPLVVSPQIDNPPKREIVGFQFDSERQVIRVLYAANEEFHNQNKGLWTAEFHLSSLAWTQNIRHGPYQSSQSRSRFVENVMRFRDGKGRLEFSDFGSDKPLGESIAVPEELAGTSVDGWSFLATSDNRNVITFGDGWGDRLHGWLFDLRAQKVVTLPFLEEKTSVRSESERVRTLFLSPDEKSLIGVGIAKVRIWDLETYKHREFALTGRIEKGVRWEAAALTPDGTRLLLGLQSSTEHGNGDVAVYDVESGKLLREISTGHLSGIASLTVSPDNAIAYSGGGDHTLRVWNIETGEAVDQPLPLPEHPSALALNATGKQLAVVTNSGVTGEFRLFDTQPWKLAGYPIAWSNGGTPVFDDEGRLVAPFDPVALPPKQTGQRYSSSSTVETVPMDEGKDYQPRQLLASATGIRLARLTSDGQSFAVLTADGTVELRSTANGELQLASFRSKSPINKFAFASGDRQIITACADGTVERWLTIKSLPPPDDPSKTLDWIEWITGSTWDPAQAKSTRISDERWQALEQEFRATK